MLSTTREGEDFAESNLTQQGSLTFVSGYSVSVQFLSTDTKKRKSHTTTHGILKQVVPYSLGENLG